MTDRPDKQTAKSRAIRDQAMAVLRDTRAKIDPKLLSLMKEKLSKINPAGMPAEPAKKTVFSEAEITKLSQPQTPPKIGAGRASAVYASTGKAFPPEPAKPDDTMEPVDRKKVAAIVMEYMKLKQENKTRH